MQLVEVMVAAAVFTAASGSSLQLFAQAAVSSQATELRQQQLERIELDRLQLQAHLGKVCQAQRSAPAPVGDGAIVLAINHHAAVMTILRRRHGRPARRGRPTRIIREIKRNDVGVDIHATGAKGHIA